MFEGMTLPTVSRLFFGKCFNDRGMIPEKYLKKILNELSSPSQCPLYPCPNLPLKAKPSQQSKGGMFYFIDFVDIPLP